MKNWERLTTCYDFLRERWKHPRTSNVVEFPLSRVSLRRGASKRFLYQFNATCVIRQTTMVVGIRF